MKKLEPLEQTLADLEDAQKVRQAQKPKLIGDAHYDRLPTALKRWHKGGGKWHEDKRKQP